MLKNIGGAIGLGMFWFLIRTPWVGLAKTTGLLIPAFAIAGCFSVWLARQVAAPPGTRAAAASGSEPPR